MEETVLLIQEPLNSSTGGLLPFQEAAVELGRILLHLLQHRHALPGDPQRLGENTGTGLQARGARLKRRGSRFQARGSRFEVCGSRRQAPSVKRLSFLLRLHIVGTANGDRHDRFFAGGRSRRLVTGIPEIQPNGVAKDSQMTEESGQVRHARAFPRRGIQSQGQMVALPQDRLHQTGETRARADLHKGADAGGMERLDLGHELHRPGQLSGKEGLGRLVVVRIGGGGGVGEDRQPRRTEGHVSQGFTKR